MGGHLLHLGMVVGADHDRIGIARHDARGIGDRLAAAELGRSGIHHDRRAAELTDRDVERSAGARRLLFEDHREYMPRERRIGVGQGTRVALFLPNTPYYVICYFAVMKLGGIVDRKSTRLNSSH